MSATSMATASIVNTQLDVKVRSEADQSIDDLTRILNLAPYHITCRPVKDLKISEDDSYHKDIYAYKVKQLEADTLLIDTIDYIVATQGKMRERRICLLIPDEKNSPAAYIFDFMEPNYIAINLIRNIMMVLSLKSETDVSVFLKQETQLDEQTKKILFSLFTTFQKSKKDMLSFLTSDKNTLNCFSSLYLKVDFKHIGSSIISQQSKEMVASTLSKICKSKPLNPSYSKPRPQDIFHQTLIERIVSLLMFGNENIEKFCLDELYGSNQNLKDQTPIFNKLIYVQSSEKMLHLLTSASSKNKDEQNNLPTTMSFSFKFQFLSNRKKPAAFLKWIDDTFKSHIEKLEDLIIKLIKEFKMTNQHEYELMQQTKKMIALFSVLKSKSIQLSLRPAFYLDFLACKQDVGMMQTLLNETIKKLEPHIKSQFSAFFDSEQVLNPTSNEYLISEATVSFIRHQIFAQLRRDHHGLNRDYNDIDSLILLSETDTAIWDALSSKAANELLKQYLGRLELDFMQDFLIQANRLEWLQKINSDLNLKSFESTNELSNQIQKLRENISNQQRISTVLTKTFTLTLPNVSARFFSNASHAFYGSGLPSIWTKLRASHIDKYNLWTLRPAELFDKTTKYVTEHFKITRSYILGFGVGLYVADPYHQLYFIAANFAFQKAYGYFKQPTLDQLLKKYDSASIVKSFDPKTKPFLTYFDALSNNDLKQNSVTDTQKTAADKGSAGQNSNMQIIPNSNATAAATGNSIAMVTHTSGNSGSENQSDNKNEQGIYKIS